MPPEPPMSPNINEHKSKPLKGLAQIIPVEGRQNAAKSSPSYAPTAAATGASVPSHTGSALASRIPVSPQVMAIFLQQLPKPSSESARPIMCPLAFSGNWIWALQYFERPSEIRAHDPETDSTLDQVIANREYWVSSLNTALFSIQDVYEDADSKELDFISRYRGEPNPKGESLCRDIFITLLDQVKNGYRGPQSKIHQLTGEGNNADRVADRNCYCEERINNIVTTMKLSKLLCSKLLGEHAHNLVIDLVRFPRTLREQYRLEACPPASKRPLPIRIGDRSRCISEVHDYPPQRAQTSLLGAGTSISFSLNDLANASITANRRVSAPTPAQKRHRSSSPDSVVPDGLGRKRPCNDIDPTKIYGQSGLPGTVPGVITKGFSEFRAQKDIDETKRKGKGKKSAGEWDKAE